MPSEGCECALFTSCNLGRFKERVIEQQLCELTDGNRLICYAVGRAMGLM